MTSTKNVIGLTVQIVGAAIIIINFFRAITSVYFAGGAVAFEIFLQGLIFGVLIVGFGEVINLLQGLFNQREPEDSPVHQKQSDSTLHSVSLRLNQSLVSSNTIRQIKALYAMENIEVENVEATPYDGFVFVYAQGKRDIVDLNGFQPEILTAKEIEGHPVLKDLTEENPS